VTRTALRWLLIAAYLYAGVVHLRSPGFFLPIMPGWVPFPRETVLLTGVCELAGAIGLVVSRLRRAAAWGLVAYAVCVFPANIQHAINDLGSGTGLPLWYHVPRLLFQPVIVWWTLWAGTVIDWPFRSAGRR
jgi:uncharacterized membrane protein